MSPGASPTYQLADIIFETLRVLWSEVQGQSKLEVVEQEMARANIDILGISEVKWTGMGEFTRGGFLPRHDEDLREPLVRRP